MAPRTTKTQTTTRTRRGRPAAKPAPAPEPESQRPYTRASDLPIDEIVKRLQGGELFTEVAAQYAALPTVRKALATAGFNVYGEQEKVNVDIDINDYPETAAGDKKLAAKLDELRQAPHYTPYYQLALATDLSEIQLKQVLEDNGFDTGRVIKPKPEPSGRGRGRPRKSEDDNGAAPARRGRGRGRTSEPEPEPTPARRGRGRPPRAAAEPEPVRRGRGRPPGSKNKPKVEEPEPVATGRRRRRSRPTR